MTFPFFRRGYFRCRREIQNGGLIDHAWRDHGDHLALQSDAGLARSWAVEAARRGGAGAGRRRRRRSRGDPDAADIDDAQAFRPDRRERQVDQTRRTGSPEQAALREAEEEIGLDRSFVETRVAAADRAAPARSITPVLSVVKRSFEMTPILTR